MRTFVYVNLNFYTTPDYQKERKKQRRLVRRGSRWAWLGRLVGDLALVANKLEQLTWTERRRSMLNPRGVSSVMLLLYRMSVD